LGGTEQSLYIRLPVPPFLMPFLGAFLGGLYILLLPLIAFPVLLWLLGAKAWKGLLAARVHPAGGKGRSLEV